MKDRRTVLFAGTTEGHQIVQAFADDKRPLLVCVATDYGKTIIEEDCKLSKGSSVEILAGRLNLEEMEALLQKEDPVEILDATHPYAMVVSKQLKTICANNHFVYTRIIREQKELSESDSHLILVENMEEAAEKVKSLSGPILLTTGSKEISTFCSCIEQKETIFARVLPSIESIELCQKAGIKQQHIIGMQGPFSTSMNRAMIQNYHICGMVTKESGTAGGFEEKYQACKAENIPLIVVTRPDQKEEGISCNEYLEHNFPDRKTLALVGIGTGKLDGITEYAKKKLAKAQVIFGAKRMLDFCSNFTTSAKMVEAYQPEVVSDYLKDQLLIKNAVVALSGDTGFFSGAKKMKEAIVDFEIEFVPGISIVEAMSARFGCSWDDMKLVSCHGNLKSPIPFILRHPKCLFLFGSKEQVIHLAKECLEYQMDQVKLFVAVNLDGDNERIQEGTPKDFIEFSADGLITVIALNPQYSNAMNLDQKDELFIRKDAPMTKREVRTLSIAKLHLSPDSIVIDVGCGTGSVGIGCAQIAYEGMVYGIEKEEKNQDLLLENKKLFQVPNFIPMIGDGVDLIPTLPKATHAFIGGSSGKMERMLDFLYENNPEMSIVINGITLETVSSVIEYGKKNHKKVDSVEIFVAATKQVGSYHMLQGNNPIFIMTLEPEVME